MEEEIKCIGRRNKMRGVLRDSKDISVARAKCVRGMVGAWWRRVLNSEMMLTHLLSVGCCDC